MIHGFPEDLLLDSDATFTEEYFRDMYDYLGMNKTISTTFHPQMDSQTEFIN
jgi:hypothetical protein